MNITGLGTIFFLVYAITMGSFIVCVSINTSIILFVKVGNYNFKIDYGHNCNGWNMFSLLCCTYVQTTHYFEVSTVNVNSLLYNVVLVVGSQLYTAVLVLGSLLYSAAPVL